MSGRPMRVDPACPSLRYGSGRHDTVVVLSAETYAELTGKRQSFKDFLMSGPSFEGLDLGRDESPMRDVEL